MWARSMRLSTASCLRSSSAPASTSLMRCTPSCTVPRASCSRTRMASSVLCLHFGDPPLLIQLLWFASHRLGAGRVHGRGVRFLLLQDPGALRCCGCTAQLVQLQTGSKHTVKLDSGDMILFNGQVNCTLWRCLIQGGLVLRACIRFNSAARCSLDLICSAGCSGQALFHGVSKIYSGSAPQWWTAKNGIPQHVARINLQYRDPSKMQ
jgi:hypothetical protein